MTITYITCFLSLCLLLFFFSCKNKNQGSDAQAGKLPHGFTKHLDTIKYYSETLEQVDAHTFEVIDDCFCKDAHQVFYFRSYRESSDYFMTKKHFIQKLEDADAATFVSLGDGYAKDKSQAWSKNQTFKVADIPGLTVLNQHFVRDNIHAYIDCVPIAGSDGKTFELIDDAYAKDALHYYYVQAYSDGGYEVTAIPCQYGSFQVLDYQFAKDARHAFYLGNKINGADPAGFELLGKGYSKDAQHVYFESGQVAGADPQTFELFKENEHSLGGTVYARDKNGIYVNEKVFKGVDGTSFKILNEKYTLDKNGVYFNMKKVKNADPNSFQVYPHYMGDADAVDKNHKYGDGRVVE